MSWTLRRWAPIALCSLIAAPAAAAILHVPADHALIQDAVDAAVAGDVVVVAAGTWTDCTHETEGPGTTPACVIMKSGVTLRGAGQGAGGTVIDAQGLGRGIFVEYATDCRIEDLRVVNAHAPAYGAGILLRHVGRDVSVSDVTVTGCTDGGVICIHDASPTLTGLTIWNNSAKQGGGLAIEENSSPRVRDCLITGNSAPSGAGVFIRNGCEPYVTRTTVSYNTIDAAYGQGAGIFVGASAPVIEGCRIEFNTSLGNGGGIAYQLGAAGVLRDTRIVDNELTQSYVYGAGIAVDSSTPLIEGCLVARNVCVGVGSDGGGVYTLFSPAPTLSHCTISHNASSNSEGAGGLLAQWGSAPLVEYSILSHATVGAGLICDGGSPDLSCTDVWGNAGGDALCGTSGGGNLALDPLFCDVTDYRLQTGSPCLDACGVRQLGIPSGDCSATAAGDLPAAAGLLGNRPNPFNPSTTIAFRLDAPGAAELRITDVAGRTVTTLSFDDLPAGRHEAVWDGRDDMGRISASGVYFYELQALGVRDSRRMILIK